MSKIIIAAAVTALFAAAPAFAQDSCGGGTTASRGQRFEGPNGSATNLRDKPSSDPTAGRGKGFDGPNGSATNLRDTPRPSGRHIRQATLSCRKTGGDAATSQSIPLRKVGTGTLQNTETRTRRGFTNNNIRQAGLANTDR